jgi:hypothetical protein
VAVFRKPAFTLTSSNAVLLLSATGGGFTLTGSSSDVQSSPFSAIPALQNTFLRGCSFVLALPPPWSSITPATVLPQPPAGQADSAMAGLKVLDQWSGQRVDPVRYPAGLKLKQSYFDPQRQRIFVVVVDAAGSAQAELNSSQVASLFGEGASPSDAVSTRTKTVGAYTIRLPSRQDMRAVMTTTPSGWSTSRRYWTSTNAGTNEVWTHEFGNPSAGPVSRNSTETFFVALEVAVAPMWYRIQSSWVNRNAPNVVCISFTDPSILEFPRVPSGAVSKLRVAAFQGLMGVESRFFMVE